MSLLVCIASSKYPHKTVV